MEMYSLASFEGKLDFQIGKFLDQIASSNRQGFEYDKKVRRETASGFEVLGLTDDFYYKGSFQEQNLEWRVRDELVNVAFDFLFKTHGYDIRWRMKNTCSTFGGYGNKENEEKFPVEFFVVIDGKYIAYRYTPFGADYSIAENLPQDFKLMYRDTGMDSVYKWYCIDWSGLTEEEIKIRNEKYYSNGYQNVISLKMLFEEYFSNEEYILFLDKMREALSSAKSMLGFQTVSRIVPDNLFVFKQEYIKQLTDVENLKYKMVTEKGDSRFIEIEIKFDEDDKKLLKRNFFTNNRKMALVGNSKFANSFVTSEYLFSVFEIGASLDYTSVVCGYIKSIEQLCESIIWEVIPKLGLTLYYPARWLTSKEKRELRNAGELKENCGPFKVLMKEGNEKYFNEKSTMKTMYDFFEENKTDVFCIQDEHAQDEIIECLKNYASFDRNGYLHRHNIDDFEIVRRIKNNTVLLYYWLLGAFAMPKERELEALGVVNNKFDILYRKIAYRHLYKYVIRTMDERLLKVVRLLESPQFEYGKHGEVVGAKLCFVEVEKYPKDYLEYKEFVANLLEGVNIITISRDKLPKELWWIENDGREEQIFVNS